MKKSKHTFGFSLIEVIIVTGLISVVGLGMLSLINYSMNSQKNVASHNDFDNLMNLTQLAMEQSAVCTGNLNQLPPFQASTKSIPIHSIFYFNGGTKGNALVETGTNYGGVTISSIELRPIQGSTDFSSEFITSGTGTVLAQIHFLSQKVGTNLGGSQIETASDIPVALNVESSGSSDVILNCLNSRPVVSPSGTMCGFTDYSEGGCGEAPSNTVTPCQGKDARLSCPTSYTGSVVGGTNCHSFYSCVAN